MKFYNQNIILSRLQNELGLSESKSANVLATYMHMESDWNGLRWTHSQVIGYIVEKYREACAK